MPTNIHNNILRATIFTALLFVFGAIVPVRIAAGHAPVVIATQPVNRTVNSGTSATFSVVASGSPPMSFQWLKNSTPIQGAKSSTYQTPATTASDNGARYSVVVSNKTSSVTSSAAALTVVNTTVAPSVATQPASQTVNPGQSATFSVATMGTAPMTYKWLKNQTAISGATSSTYQTPATTTSDNGTQFIVVATNTAGTTTSNAAMLTVNPATYLLGASTTQLNFGSVNVSSTSIQAVTLTNTGNSNVTISNVAFSGAGFTVTGGNGLTLSPLQKTSIAVTFSPAAAGSVAGTVNVTSNAAPIAIALSGTGLAKVAYSVSLNWTASTSPVIGYNVYSSTVPGGPYSKATSAPTATTSYMDSAVQSAHTYYYVTRSVDASNTESANSTEVSAVVP